MDSRKQFEDFSAWYAEYEKQRSAKGWMPLESHIVNHMSICWHASRESLVIELPHDVMHVTNISYEDGRDDVITAIHTAGIRTK